jgi:hypothetical protein
MSPGARYLLHQIPRGEPTDSELTAVIEICESRGDTTCVMVGRGEQNRRREVESTYHPEPPTSAPAPASSR